MRARYERLISGGAILTTLTMVSLTLWGIGSAAATTSSPWRAVEACVFALIVLFLAWGGLVYQLNRLGYFHRLHRERPGAVSARRAEVDGVGLTVLIPSYREEPKILAQTVLSAALMDCPGRRVVVLLDDPPTGGAAQIEALLAARRLVADLDRQFDDLAAQLSGRADRAARRLAEGCAEIGEAAADLASLHRHAAAWLASASAGWADGQDPADRFFRERIVLPLIEDHRRQAESLAAAAPDAATLAGRFAALADRYRLSISSFERKRYANLSHAPNKAMNLNAYIGLLGHAYREAARPSGLYLEACSPEVADIEVPEAEFLLTLDADSLVLADYAAKLVAIMRADPRIAVAQTPYSAFPGAPGLLERIAGATTDMQYLAHQGSSAFSAAYWVGANALLRREALADIRVETLERGHAVPVFIQDRTVIEDTGSTVDLISRGWRLHNHPERLAYSATPADFGSLTIQRRRWSNGGLILFPDLARYLLRGPGKGLEGLIRAHYLLSPAAANVGLLALLLFPFDPSLAGVWLPLSAAPYYFLYGRDLKQNGYRWGDLMRVYALNLLLLPVNLAGVADSVRQLASGRKTPFARTPKVEGRTATPWPILALQVALILYMTVALGSDLLLRRWDHAVFSGLNLALLVYAFQRFVGLRNAWADIVAAGARPAAAANEPLAPALPAGVIDAAVAAVAVRRAREPIDA